MIVSILDAYMGEEESLFTDGLLSDELFFGDGLGAVSPPEWEFRILRRSMVPRTKRLPLHNSDL